MRRFKSMAKAEGKTSHSPCEHPKQREDIESNSDQKQDGARDVCALAVHAEENAARDECHDRSDPLPRVAKAKDKQGNNVHHDGNNGANPRLREDSITT